MKYLNAILLVLVMLSSLSVVTSQHTARLLYNDVQTAQRLEQQLNIEYGQLILEQGTWGAHAVIEHAARSLLNMHTPEAQEIQIIAPQKAK